MSDIQLQISGKQIDTIPIINLLRQGENNADTILMQLPPKYGDIALDGLTYIMYGDSKSGTRATQVLEKAERIKSLRSKIRCSPIVY